MAITRAKQSSLTTGVTKYDNLRAGLPFTPTIGTATDGGTGTTVSVAFTGNNTAGLTYTALSTPGSLTGTSTTSPITVTGLTSGTAYTFAVKATNSAGDSPYSAASNSVTPATPSSFESIATVTAAGGESSLSFTSVPGTYKHLQIRGIARTQASAVLSLSRVRFNSDTGANYTQHTLYGNGSAVAVDTNTSDDAIQWLAPVPGNNATANVFGAMILDIHDYASTTKYKTVRVFAGDDGNAANTDYRVFLKSGLWMSTSAITNINLFCSGINWAAGTTFALYGVK